jgi:Ni/Co efflux regulator RcnB
MRRLILTLAAVFALAGTLATGGLALAKDKQGSGFEARGGRGGDGGWQQRGPSGPPGGWRGPDRGGRGPGGDLERRGPRMEPRYPVPPAAFGPRVRRGGYMPPAYRDGVVSDYGRLRLRPPPRGYAWVRVGGGYALVSTRTGQVFDIVPF